jgi:hypothetical protein
VKGWKYALGTFTFYGLLFLAYGELACFVINIRDFSSQLSAGVSLMVGAVFAIALTLSVIALCKEPNWYGCFRKKFFKFEISSYLYVFSSA